MKNARRLLLVGAALTLAALSPRGARAQQVNIGGVVYSQYAWQLADAANDDNAFDVTRAYLNVTGTFDHGITTRVTPDLYRADNGSLDFRLKYAYFTWSPEHSPVTLKFGQTQTPFVDWQEGLWGYRMQGPVAVDKFGYLTSSDIGIGLDGAWSGQKVNLQLMASNGEGYHAAEADKHKDVAARVSVRLLPSDDGGSRGGLRITGLAHLGTRTGGGARNRYIGELSWKSSLLTLAGEVAHAVNGSGDAAVADVGGNLFSAFGVLNVPDSKLAVLGRVDVNNPNTDVADDRQVHFLAGVSYRLGQNVTLLADWDRMHYQGAVPASAAARLSTLLFQTQFTF